MSRSAPSNQGAFTGASKTGKEGLFEAAHEGTIFLDEVSEIPLTLQSRLLRVIQEREVRRIGANRVIPINVRIICATNKNLLDMIQADSFLTWLYENNIIAQLYSSVSA